MRLHSDNQERKLALATSDARVVSLASNVEIADQTHEETREKPGQTANVIHVEDFLSYFQTN